VILQYPIIGYIDSSSLVRVTISQTNEQLSFSESNFTLSDEDGNNIKILSAVASPRSLYLTGDFFDWQINEQGKLLWNAQNQYYYCELPRKMVMNKDFKFVENGCIWHPATANITVDEKPGSFQEKGYIFCDDKVRFVLKHNSFGFHSIELELHTETALQPDKQHFLSFHGHHKIGLINRDIFDQEEFYYANDDLGSFWTKDAADFRIWSPIADKMELLLYKDSKSAETEQVIAMHKTDSGVWHLQLSGNWENYYYQYRITNDSTIWQQIDPYSRALSINSKRSLIFDADKTDPEGWKQEQQPILEFPTDAVIYEMHVRDFTISSGWNGTENLKGKYGGLAWSSKITTHGKEVIIGMQHLHELGINVVQLLPVYDFNTVDETGNDPRKLRNWGYDPFAYNVPEGSYAQNPDDSRRIYEFKEMVMHFHKNGIKVVMDVVYNHTANVGAPFSIFDTFMPEYFYRMDRTGQYTNGSGCGNEIASEKKMVRKYIIDSLRYWATEFHIDGFRFDLMGLIDVVTMQTVVKELKTIKSDILIYGEPWAGGASPLKNPAIKGSQRNQNFAVFNDDFRDSVRGDTDGIKKGWAMGDVSLQDKVMMGVIGSVDNFADQPAETVNYISAHDNYTWYDKLVRSTPGISEPDRIKMAKLGLAVIITSQGIPFLHAGSEFLRTKRAADATEEEIRNSYRADDEVNKIEWSRKAEYYEVFKYIKRLLEIRKSHSGLRLNSNWDIRERMQFIKAGIPKNLIVYKISGMNTTTDLIIIHNPLNQKAEVKLPQGIWKLIFDEDFEQRQKQAVHIENNITIPPISTTILELD